MSAVEHLAIVEPIARRIVEVKRLRGRIVRLESIAAAARSGKIYPLFNQIKSRTGVVATNGPSLFDIEGPSELKSCFDARVRDLFVDAKTSLHICQAQIEMSSSSQSRHVRFRFCVFVARAVGVGATDDPASA